MLDEAVTRYSCDQVDLAGRDQIADDDGDMPQKNSKKKVRQMGHFCNDQLFEWVPDDNCYWQVSWPRVFFAHYYDLQKLHCDCNFFSSVFKSMNLLQNVTSTVNEVCKRLKADKNYQGDHLEIKNGEFNAGKKVCLLWFQHAFQHASIASLFQVELCLAL